MSELTDKLTERIFEPELMDDAEQVSAYANADFAEAIEVYLSQFKKISLPESGRLLDLGCGPGEISAALAQRWPQFHVTAVDGAAKMIDWAEKEHPGPEYLCARLNEIPDGKYEVIVSNSLLHHLHKPEELWQAIKRHGTAGSVVLVMDLMRPQSPEGAQEIVEMYSAEETEVLKRDFFNSLCAAFRPEEIRNQLNQAGLADFTVEVISDRHLCVFGVL